MSNRVEQQLRESALNDQGDDEQITAIVYRVEREIVPLLRAIRDLVNSVLTGFGDSVDITTADSPYTMKTTTEYIRADATDGNIVLLVPASDTTTIRFLSIKKVDVSVNTVAVTAVDGEDLDGGQTAPVTSGQTFIRLIPRGGGYDIA